MGSKSRIFFAAHLPVTNWKDEAAIAVEHDTGYLSLFSCCLSLSFPLPSPKIDSFLDGLSAKAWEDLT